MKKRITLNLITKLVTVTGMFLITGILFYEFVFKPVSSKIYCERKKKFIDCICSSFFETLSYRNPALTPEQRKENEAEKANQGLGVDPIVSECAKKHSLNLWKDDDIIFKLGQATLIAEMDKDIREMEGVQKLIELQEYYKGLLNNK